MTWTYAPDFTTSRDKIRLEIGDTDTTDQLLSDEEIAYFAGKYSVSTESGLLLAAARCCEAIAAELARRVDISRSLGGEKIDKKAHQAYEHYQTLTTTLREKAVAVAGVSPFAGGISRDSKDTYEEDSDRVEPAFTRELHEGPNTRRGNDRDAY